jgi:hypothetical protein
MAEEIGGLSSIANIPADDLRESLRRTMVMGMPETVADRPTFYFEGEQTYADADLEGSPWDWTDTPSSDTAKDPAQVLCAYEFFSPLGRQGAFLTEVGEFNPTTVVLTMFEDEFNTIYGFTYCTIGPSDQRWYFRFFKPSVGLGTLTVYQVHCVATGIE